MRVGNAMNPTGRVSIWVSIGKPALNENRVYRFLFCCLILFQAVFMNRPVCAPNGSALGVDPLAVGRVERGREKLPLIRLCAFIFHICSQFQEDAQGVREYDFSKTFYNHESLLQVVAKDVEFCNL